MVGLGGGTGLRALAQPKSSAPATSVKTQAAMHRLDGPCSARAAGEEVGGKLVRSIINRL
jgi:hypothetical protein